MYNIVYSENFPITSNEEIQDYILSLDFFTTKEIEEKFLFASWYIIYIILKNLKDKNLITSTDKGKYVVIK